MASILIIDDDVDILSSAKLFLKRHFDEVVIEKNPEKIPYLINNFNFDLILLDMNFTRDVNSGNEGFNWLDKILDVKPESNIVLFTAYGDVEMAVKAIKLGAKDFVLKPWDNDKLLEILQNAIGGTRPQKLNKEHNIIGKSKVMMEVLDTMKTVANTDANILILGENGTGKDMMAQAIHNSSNRKKSPFIRVDLAAVPDSLVESELFGHKKGAFTDAKEDRTGKFELAQNGTLFLDEIGNLNNQVQSKLLSVLQNRELTKVGDTKPIPLNIRLISATNIPILEDSSSNNFRKDLLYRINTISIVMPPLRERGDDILLLAETFLETYNKKYNRNIKGLSAKLSKQMLVYSWPGNVRELQHAIERAVILSKNKELSIEDVFGNKEKSNTSTKSFDLESMEKEMILKSLKRHKGNISEAAKELGLSRASLYRRIQKYEI